MIQEEIEDLVANMVVSSNDHAEENSNSTFDESESLTKALTDFFTT